MNKAMDNNQTTRNPPHPMPKHIQQAHQEGPKTEALPYQDQILIKIEGMAAHMNGIDIHGSI